MAKYELIETFHGKRSTYDVQRSKGGMLSGDKYYVVDRDSGKTAYTTSDRSDAVRKARELADRY